MRFILFSFLLLSMFASGQKKLDRAYFINLLNKQQNDRVFDEAMTLRKQPYGKSAIVDYFIARSLCQGGQQQKSLEWLDYILTNYPLKSDTRKFVESDIRSCKTGMPAKLGTIAGQNALSFPKASLTSIGKAGVTYICHSAVPATFENMFSEEDLESRLFSKDQSRQAKEKITAITGAGYDINVRKRFMLVSLQSDSLSKQVVEDVIDELDKTANFFLSFYGLRPPDKLITVYLLPDTRSLQSTARKVHGIELPDVILGYSILSDLSLSGIASKEARGTLLHELFHLIVRTDAGDIPAWLDEGMASLYSNYYWENDQLKGYERPWRLEQLSSRYINQTGKSIPALRSLFQFNWQQFNGGEDNDLCQASIDYALSNMFLVYLQEKNLLANMISAFRQRGTPGTANSAAGTGSLQIVEKVMNLPVDQIEQQFKAWFAATYGAMPQPGLRAAINENADRYANNMAQQPANAMAQPHLNAMALPPATTGGSSYDILHNNLSMTFRQELQPKLNSMTSKEFAVFAGLFSEFLKIDEEFQKYSPANVETTQPQQQMQQAVMQPKISLSKSKYDELIQKQTKKLEDLQKRVNTFKTSL